jgi:hypothetical protein
MTQSVTAPVIQIKFIRFLSAYGMRRAANNGRDQMRNPVERAMIIAKHGFADRKRSHLISSILHIDGFASEATSVNYATHRDKE